VKDAYRRYTNDGSRPSWDPIAVYMAVNGYDSLYSSLTPVTVAVDYYGRESYNADTGANQFQVWIDGDHNGDVTREIDNMLCSAPCRGDCSGYEMNSMKNCYGGHGATDLEQPSTSSAGTMDLSECLALCDETDGCEGVAVSQAGSGQVECYRKADIDIAACDSYIPFDTWVRK
jgi:hypothetical protein